jgi:hypothetical protein
MEGFTWWTWVQQSQSSQQVKQAAEQQVRVLSILHAASISSTPPVNFAAGSVLLRFLLAGRLVG